MDIAWQIFLLLPLCVATTMSGWNIVLFCMLFPFPSLPFSFSRHQHHMHSFALFLSPSSLLVKVPHTTLFYSLLVIVLFSNNIDYLVFFFFLYFKPYTKCIVILVCLFSLTSIPCTTSCVTLSLFLLFSLLIAATWLVFIVSFVLSFQQQVSSPCLIFSRPLV
jgi:hypothetical protein